MKSADFARGGLPLIDAAPPCGRLPAEKYFFRKRGFRKNDVNLFAAGALQPLPGGSGTAPAACAEGGFALGRFGMVSAVPLRLGGALNGKSV